MTMGSHTERNEAQNCNSDAMHLLNSIYVSSMCVIFAQVDLVCTVRFLNM